MSAAELRKAAETLRERAQKATPGPWFTDSAGTHGVFTEARVSATSEDVAFGSDGYVHVTNNDVWIATMHPGVGLALADLLDARADWFDAGYTEDHSNTQRSALTVARLINGGV